MKGIELSEKYYGEFGKKMLEEDFSDILPYISVGICGSGSECMGYDDGISSDHDFEPGFAIFVPDEDTVDRKTAFRLERAYAKLPKEFMGYFRSPVPPRDGLRHGVIRLSDFLVSKTGRDDGIISAREWLRVPESSLNEAINGKLFYDGNGVFSAVRKYLTEIPRDVTLKKLAGELFLMGQSGQYNYERCISHGETGGAQLAVIAFVQNAMKAVFSLNGRYMPYYKWSFRAMRDLPMLGNFSDSFEYLISSDNTDTFKAKKEIIEDISMLVCDKLRELSFSDEGGNDLVRQAYCLNNKIADPEIRNLHILYAVD